jgi:hypothetical protein
LIGVGRATVAAALCAQIAHAAVYGSLLPTAGAHGYLIWYVPTLTVVSGAALLFVPASIAANAVATGRHTFGAILPERHPGRAARDVVRLALAAGALFLVQESAERTVETGALRVATFAPLDFLVLALALVLAAVGVVAAERMLEELAGRLGVTPQARAMVTSTWVRRSWTTARPQPLSVHGGVRAPPVTV